MDHNYYITGNSALSCSQIASKLTNHSSKNQLSQQYPQQINHIPPSKILLKKPIILAMSLLLGTSLVWADGTTPLSSNVLPDSNINIDKASIGDNGEHAFSLTSDVDTPDHNISIDNWQISGGEGGDKTSGYGSAGRGGNAFNFNTNSGKGLTLNSGNEILGGAGGSGLGSNGGGAGGHGINLSGHGYLKNNGIILAGIGGTGNGSFSSGGGAGGYGIDFSGSGSIENTGAIIGGAGGLGTGSFSNGGAGGYGIKYEGQGSIINSGDIWGGNGGHSSLNTGGDGGYGIYYALNSVGDFTNTGSINGGTGGNAGSGSYNSAGKGGYGISYSGNGNFSNIGEIYGGTGGFGRYGDGGRGVYFSCNSSCDPDSGNLSNSGIIMGGNGGGNEGGSGGDAIIFSAKNLINYAGSVVKGGLGADGGGGSGGAGINFSGINLSNAGQIFGGDGGVSGTNSSFGGKGGIGLDFYGANSNDLVNTGHVQGGNGGDGVNGGDGGDGIEFSGNTFINTGSIIAGNAGIGSTSTGKGGVGLEFMGKTLVNTGTIMGGSGAPNTSSYSNPYGYGIYTWGYSPAYITNSGTIIGGVKTDGSRYEAIYLYSQNNTVELHGGSQIIGDIYAHASNQHFVLGGDVNAIGGNHFDISQITAIAPTWLDPNDRWTDFTKKGTSFWTLSGVSSVNMDWDVQQGKLIVGGVANDGTTLTGNINVQSGAILGGHGVINGTINLISGAAINPGNSIGTLTAGAFNFSAGSIYEFEVKADDTSDKITADANLGTGNIVISGGEIHMLPIDGVVSANQSYSIAEAINGGTISGAFDAVKSDFIFLSPELRYTSTHVYLDALRNTRAFNSIAFTYNQVNTANAIDSMGAGNLYNIIASTTNVSTALKAYDNLSGEIHVSAKSALLVNSRYVRDAINQHLITSSYDRNTLTTNRVPVWLSAWGHDGDLKDDDNAAKANNKSYGFLVGSDTSLNNAMTLGAAIGYENTKVDVRKNRNSDANIDSFHLALYGSYQSGASELRAGIGYSFMDIDTTRNIDVNSLEGINKSSYNGNLWQAFIEGGHTFYTSSNTNLMPFVQLAYTHLNTDSFKENGGSDTTLQSAKQNSDVFNATLGIHGTYKLDNAGKFNLYGDLGWQHILGDSTPKSDLRFRSGGEKFNIKGVGMAKNSAIAGVGINIAPVKAVRLSLGYQGEFGDNIIDNSANARLSYRF